MVKIVEDVFSQGFLEVNENDTLSSCLSLFKKERRLKFNPQTQLCDSHFSRP
jgi:hypothetical protein